MFLAAGEQTLFRGADFANIILYWLRVAETYRASPQDYKGIVIAVPAGGYSKAPDTSLKPGRYIPLTFAAEPINCPISALADLFIHKFGRGFVSDKPAVDLLSVIQSGN